jgi:hypothetical protein
MLLLFTCIQAAAAAAAAEHFSNFAPFSNNSPIGAMFLLLFYIGSRGKIGWLGLN